MRTKTERLVVGLRNHDPDQAIWMTISNDNGKKWEPVWKTDMIGHPVDLVQLLTEGLWLPTGFVTYMRSRVV